MLLLLQRGGLRASGSDATHRRHAGALPCTPSPSRVHRGRAVKHVRPLYVARVRSSRTHRPCCCLHNQACSLVLAHKRQSKDQSSGTWTAARSCHKHGPRAQPSLPPPLPSLVLAMVQLQPPHCRPHLPRRRASTLHPPASDLQPGKPRIRSQTRKASCMRSSGGTAARPAHKDGPSDVQLAGSTQCTAPAHPAAPLVTGGARATPQLTKAGGVSRARAPTVCRRLVSLQRSARCARARRCQWPSS